MDELKKYRQEIDSVDQELIRLFEQRMFLSAQVAEYKKARSLEIFQPDREKEVLAKARNHLQNPVHQDGLQKWFQTMLEVSKDYQRQLLEPAPTLIGFQGVPGSFSEEALIRCFGDESARSPYQEFEDVFTALQKDEIHYGVLPIENSSTGAIVQVYDLLRRYGFAIVGETHVQVNHHLMALPGTSLREIEEVYSHSQGLEQSSEFLKRYPHWKLIPYHNTATSAHYVSTSGCRNQGAIASGRAAKLYGLEILQWQINNQKNNHTRFIVIGKELKTPENADKISVVFALEHKSGSLYQILEAFAKQRLNLLKLESRPMADNLWKYFFYVDFEGSVALPEVKTTLDYLARNTSYYRLLGVYARDRQEGGLYV